MPTLAEEKRAAYKKAIIHVNTAIAELDIARMAVGETGEATNRMGRKAVDTCETYRERLRYLLEDWNRVYP